MKTIEDFMTAILLISSVSLGCTAAESTQDYALHDLDCAQLYQLASLLEPQGQRHKSIIFNNRSRILATTIGAVENVGFALFGIDLAWTYYDDWRRLNKNRQLELVRLQMAGKFCFEKT